jgi:hypothetical protein
VSQRFIAVRLNGRKLQFVATRVAPWVTSIWQRKSKFSARTVVCEILRCSSHRAGELAIPKREH